MVARSLCRLKWFRLGAVPEAERRSALAIQATAWRPFEESAYRVAVQGDSGLVFAWDAAAAERALQEAGLTPQRCRITPETVWWERPQDGASVLACLEGFEGQVWQDGQLHASRWWPQAPSEPEWQQFLHVGSAPAGSRSEPVPQPQTRAWLARPWAELRGGEGGPSSSGVIEARVVAAGGLLLVAALAGFGQRLMEVEGALSARAQSIAELKQSTAQVIAARDQALSQAATARLFASWLTEPLPIEVVAHLHDVLGKSGAQIKELELTGSRLRLGMAVPAPASRSNIVRDLQSGSWLKDVSEVKTDSARGLVVMDMRLDGPRAPPLRSPVTAAAPPLPAPADASKARAQEPAAAAVTPPLPRAAARCARRTARPGGNAAQRRLGSATVRTAGRAAQPTPASKDEPTARRRSPAPPSPSHRSSRAHRR